MKLILGTAGHIDHGKTALVRALTGIDTDRLPEEKARGITIDLGFASLQIDDVSIGIVDVPGHEDFIRNMLAGATGIDAVLLVVAADEGVMPQTREHVAILDLLNVQRGIVAITKADLVDADWLELVAEDVRGLLRTTSLRESPVVAVSAVSGQGMAALQQAIVQQARHSAPRHAADLFRMPIDRVFTVRGTGTVATGTVWSGRVGADENVRIVPGDASARVRAVQVHGVSVSVAQAGERAAVALGGVDKSALSRGQVLVSAAEWQSVRMLTVHLRVLRDTEWLVENRQRVHVHSGTAEVLARVVLLDTGTLQPGADGWAQLRLEAPLVARVGDRLVLRSYSPVTTIAGAVVADLAEKKLTRIDAAQTAALTARLSFDAREAVRAVLALRGPNGVREAQLAIDTRHAPEAIRHALDALGEDVVPVGQLRFARDVAERLVNETVAAAEQLHAAQPLRPMLERAELRAALHGAAPELIDYAIDAAARAGLLTTNGSFLARAGFTPALTTRQLAVKQALLETLRAAGLAAPLVPELVTSFNGADVEALLKLLAYEGSIASVAPELYVESTTLDEARRRTRAELNGQKLSAADFRATLPVSRKHLIPILEYFDRTGVTRRDGDLRTVIPAETPLS